MPESRETFTEMSGRVVEAQNSFFLYRWKTVAGTILSNIGNAQNLYSQYYSGNPLCIGFIDTGASNVDVVLEIYAKSSGNYSVKGESWAMVKQIS